jgi:hypothetical protein
MPGLLGRCLSGVVVAVPVVGDERGENVVVSAGAVDMEPFEVYPAVAAGGKVHQVVG